MDDIKFGWGNLPGDLYEKWPKDETGAPEAPVFLTHCRSNDMEDVVTENMLGAYGIPVLRTYPGDGSFGKVVLGMSGTGSDLLVPASLLEDAKALMEAETDDELQSGI